MIAKSVAQMNVIALAFVGDSVYEIYVREKVVALGNHHTDVLHKRAVEFVKASAQAKVAKILEKEDFLTPEEKDVFRRGRNHRSASKPKNANPMEYKLATALEAVLGALHLSGDRKRVEEIINKAFEIIEGRNRDE